MQHEQLCRTLHAWCLCEGHKLNLTKSVPSSTLWCTFQPRRLQNRCIKDEKQIASFLLKVAHVMGISVVRRSFIKKGNYNSNSHAMFSAQFLTLGCTVCMRLAT